MTRWESWLSYNSEVEDVGGHELDGGTRLEVEMGRILVCFLKQPLDENRFGHLEGVHQSISKLASPPLRKLYAGFTPPGKTVCWLQTSLAASICWLH